MYVRKGNIKFTVVQDNVDKTLKIEEVEHPKDDKSLAYGYQDSHLIGMAFKEILSEDTAEILDDYIEYDFSSPDFKDVCDKIIHFEIIDSGNNKNLMDIHVERAVSTPERQVFFILLEKRLYLRDRIKAVIDAQPENLKVDEQTGFMHNSTYIEVVDEVMDFLNDNQSINSIFYTISIENYSEIATSIAPDKTDYMVTEVAEAIKKGFRTRDIIAYLGDGVFSAILIRIDESEALIPVNRFEIKLRSAMIPSAIGTKFTVITRYQLVDLEMEAKALIEKCKKSKKLLEMNLQ